MLTDRIKELIARARIVRFASWEAHPAASITIFQAAEDARVYLSDDDYAKIAALSPQTSSLIPIAQLLRDRVVEIVDEARVEVFAQFPDITAPGGGLYPPERAEACWRDSGIICVRLPMALVAVMPNTPVLPDWKICEFFIKNYKSRLMQ